MASSIPTYTHTALPSSFDASLSSVGSTSPLLSSSASSSAALPANALLLHRQPSSSHDAHSHSHAGHAHDDHYQHSAHGHSHGTPASSSSSSSSSASHHAHSHGPSSSSSALHRSSSVHDSGKLHGPPFTLSLSSFSVPFFLSLLSSPDTQRLTLYTLLKLLYSLLQLLLGIATSSPPLTSDSFHTFFDCIAMSCSLYAILVSRRPFPSSSPFSYGMGRHQLVAAFTNAIFLYFVSTFLFIELFHSLTAGKADAAEESSPWSLRMVWLGLVVDAVGLCLFVRWHQVAQCVTSAELNAHSIFLFAASDSLQHTMALLTALLPALSPSLSPSLSHLSSLSFLLTSVVVLYLTTPLFTTTASTLLHCTPPHLRHQLERTLREVSFHDGVLECRDAHWWQVGGGAGEGEGLVGSVHVRVRGGVDEDAVGREVRGMLGKWVQDLTVQMEKDAASAWMTGGQSD